MKYNWYNDHLVAASGKLYISVDKDSWYLSQIAAVTANFMKVNMPTVHNTPSSCDA